MSKEALINELQTVIAARVQAFLNAKSDAEAQHDAQMDEVKRRMDAESIPAVKAALKTALKEMEDDRPDASAERRQAAAFAIVHICHGLKLPVALKEAGTKAAKVEGGEKKQRMSRAETKEIADKIHAILVAKKTAKVVELADAVGVDAASIRSALLRLAREGKAVSSGVKGRNGSWKVK